MSVEVKRTKNPDSGSFEPASWNSGEDSVFGEGQDTVYFPSTSKTFLKNAVENWETEEGSSPAKNSRKRTEQAPQQEAQPS